MEILKINQILAQAKKNTSRKALYNALEEDVMLGLFYHFSNNVYGSGKELQDKEFFIGILMKVARWMTSDKVGKSLFISGDVGIGKTTILKSIKDFMNATPLASGKRFVSANYLGDIALNSESSWKMCLSCPILLIDDIGKEAVEVKNFGNPIQALVEIVDRRDDANLTTIITSNLDIQGIKDKYGPRTADRINNYEKIVYNRESYRGVKL